MAAPNSRPLYFGLLRKESGTCYGVDFPDFPGCVTAGDTAAEARDNAVAVLRLHIEDMIEDGEALPDPAPLDEILLDPHNLDAAAIAIELPQPRGRAVRVQVTIEENLLAKIDDAARAAGTSRSGYLADAARDRLDRPGA